MEEELDNIVDKPKKTKTKKVEQTIPKVNIDADTIKMVNAFKEQLNGDSNRIAAQTGIQKFIVERILNDENL